MTRRFAIATAVTLLHLVMISPTLGAGEDVKLESELAALTRSLTQLVEILAKQEQERAVDRELNKLRVAVAILEIRAHRYEASQRELRVLEETAEHIQEDMVTSKSMLAATKKQLIESIDESEVVELEANRDIMLARLEILNQRLEHTTRRQVELQNLILGAETSVQDVEVVIDEWLSSFQRASAP